MVGDETAGAVVGPFHGSAEQPRSEQRRQVFGIRRALHAERPADIEGQHANLLAIDVQPGRQQVLHPVHALRTDAQGVATVGRVVRSDRGARLHRADHHAIVHRGAAGDVRGAGEGGVDLVRFAVLEFDHQVSGGVVVQQRRAFGIGVLRRGHRRQRLDIHHDRFGGQFRDRDRLRHHRGDGIADEAHLIRGEHRPRRFAHRAAVGVGHVGGTGERADTGGGEVVVGVNAEHAGHGARLGGIDAAQDAVRVAAAQHHQVGLAVEIYVVGVLALATQEYRILVARHRLPDREAFLVPDVGGDIHASISVQLSLMSAQPRF